MEKPDFNATFAIGDRQIGHAEPVFVIAEIGVNHNGDPALARAMVDAAADCGVDCVKFQTFRAEEFMSDRKLEYTYTQAGQTVRENMFDMFKRLELPTSAYLEIFDYARRRGVVPLTSVADPLSLEVVMNCQIAAIKLASEDLINLPLVAQVAQVGLPLILSTGMADIGEVDDALRVLRAAGVRDAVFLHCVSVYPTPAAYANLHRMLGIREIVGPAPVGYSDHVVGIEACMGAVALGATVIEKHFTLDRMMPGPDQALSSDPTEMASLVGAIRRMERMRGQPAVVPSALEQESRLLFRRSVVATRDLPAGHLLTAGDLAARRPGAGLRPREIPKLLGRRLRGAVPCDGRVMWENLDDE